MKDIAQRFPENPLLLPKDLPASGEGLQIISLLNPGVFRYQNKTWLLVRVAEGVAQKEGVIFFPSLPYITERPMNLYVVPIFRSWKF